MVDALDLIYVHLIDRLEARCLAAIAAGAEIDPDEERAKFDAGLFDEPKPISDADYEQLEWRQAFGLR